MKGFPVDLFQLPRLNINYKTLNWIFELQDRDRLWFDVRIVALLQFLT